VRSLLADAAVLDSDLDVQLVQRGDVDDLSIDTHVAVGGGEGVAAPYVERAVGARDRLPPEDFVRALETRHDANGWPEAYQAGSKAPDARARAA
jgi:hypothetical protein